ncbi:type II secretion system major pseudopilin GspG [Brevundimonas sp.]|uniref:type II secretion system major pseudopilin GspG n=1 Tax=Brevundimonas sp. TaxID=1871086 RepID=UPI00286A1887|nr:type II secretion system major pseudopilin GspG [Brevundimonas sp.]
MFLKALRRGVATRRVAIRSREGDRAGFSLLEILVVLAIIALIAAVVGPRLFAQLDRSKTQTARLQIRSLEAALETMRLDIGRLPTEQEGLGLLIEADPQAVSGWYGPYLDKALPADPWGRPYVYVPAPAEATGAPGQASAAAKVVSYGADGTEGGQGVNADVSSDQAR